MKKTYILLIITICIIHNLNAQFVNEGDFYINPNITVSVYEDVTNSNGAELVNNGDLYLFNNLTNNGTIGFTDTQNTSVLNFVGNQEQTINGTGVTNFYDVEFNNTFGSFAFSLDKEININGTSFFQQGIVHETAQGVLNFQANADYENLGNQSYANNKSRKIGNTAFVFPVGDYQADTFIVRPAAISAPADITDQFFIAFNWSNSDVNFSHSNKEDSIGLIDMNEFWEINREVGNSDVAVTLTWNDTTTPDFIRSNPSEMIIVRWDGNQWVDEGGTVDTNTLEITSNVTGYGIFTLASRLDGTTPADLDFSDSFSPDGDGINDVFIIPGLVDEYPNFKMKIYNRYGSIVYDYKNNGNLNPLWWNGKSKKGVSISGNSETAPAATYWYIIYFNDGKTKPFQGWLYLNK